jgi:hypothetical protein
MVENIEGGEGTQDEATGTAVQPPEVVDAPETVSDDDGDTKVEGDDDAEVSHVEPSAE